MDQKEKKESTSPVYQCPKCQYRTSIKQSMKRHHFTHLSEFHKPKPHICSACKKGFSQNSDLKRHQLLMHDITQISYQCPYCTYVGKLKKYLMEHLKIHSNIQNYICEICGSCFNCKSNLNAHLNTHMRSKTKTCEKCGKNILYKSFFAHTQSDCVNTVKSAEFSNREINSSSLHETTNIHAGNIINFKLIQLEKIA